LFTKYFTSEDYDNRGAVRGQGNEQYHTRKMFPSENFHYRKNIRIIGGVDLNKEKFVTEYKKRYLDRYPDYVRKNEPYYLMAQAARQFEKYMTIVHGPEAA
jgi:hypothetical protein